MSAERNHIGHYTLRLQPTLKKEFYGEEIEIAVEVRDPCWTTSFNKSVGPITNNQAESVSEIRIRQASNGTRTFSLSPSTILPAGTTCSYTADIVLADTAQIVDFVRVADDSKSFTVSEAELPTDIPPIKVYWFQLRLSLTDNSNSLWLYDFSVSATHPCV